ncbi:hypothetical protein AB0H43_22495 [Hamadaea sp. NPDC050747]|uniref:hypothetical protein n=1 Tax=Hamadaea sp. NPDC050747 TaxID=3155789 RepID=UPI0033DEF9BB
MIPHEDASSAEIAETTITTSKEVMTQAAQALVGEPGAYGGMGGEFAVFESDVVNGAVANASANVPAGNPKILESLFFGQSAKTQTAALSALADDILHGVYALGNSVGVSADSYDEADRTADHTMDGVETSLTTAARDGLFP